MAQNWQKDLSGGDLLPPSDTPAGGDGVKQAGFNPAGRDGVKDGGGEGVKQQADKDRSAD